MIVWPVSWGCLQMHGIPSHSVPDVWFECVEQSATVLAANAGTVYEAR